MMAFLFNIQQFDVIEGKRLHGDEASESDLLIGNYN
jgi:hypothetical protein